MEKPGMEKTRSEIAVIPIAIVLVGGFLWYEFLSRPVSESERLLVPDFASIKDVRTKKETFFDFMLPIVRRANDEVRKDRGRLKRIARSLDGGNKANEDDARFLSELALRYRLKSEPLTDPDVIQQLLIRVDTVPASLVLAQSANESAWGTARFARDGNNYFGIWCWKRNCGLVPNDRDEGARHEVASFDTIRMSIDYYLLTLNSHPAYDTLREIRATLKLRDMPVKGWDLAAGLIAYSERREAYVDEIRAMIEINDLHQYTRINYDF